MTTKAIREAEAAVAAARLDLRVAELALARAKDALPAEPPRGTNIRFRVQFAPGERTYTYIALRTDEGHWLITGKQYGGKPLTWEKIVSIADRNYKGRPHFEDIT